MSTFRLLHYPIDGDPKLCLFTKSDAIPPYTILSHTWGNDGDEVTFDDMQKGTGRQKKGFEKILFCADLTRRDGFEYFWVDSCCINKGNNGNSVELRQAIASMFKWYQRSEKCYVYLSDVLSLDGWEEAFRESRWFKRGWTLQELLAPSSVEFYSVRCDRLGDKSSLESHIHEVTEIPVQALQGQPLTDFGIDVRNQWTIGRETKRPEDMAYSLMGIFDVTMQLSYGEGWNEANRRLQELVQRTANCLKDLRVTDPKYDKERLERQKGGLLADAWKWILHNSIFRRWQTEEDGYVLWIKGDAGKGKTMLLCGIIDELKRSIPRPIRAHIAFCFCVATDSTMNSATTTLRRLIWMLVSQQPSLITHVRDKYDHAGANLFSDSNAWLALRDIFIRIIQDRELRPTYLIIDALDECMATNNDLPDLLELIAEMAPLASRVKWILSSRNYSVIERRLSSIQKGLWLSLELSEHAISAAVKTYVDSKINQLSYTDQEVSEKIRHYLLSNANGTFLWVALVCQELGKVKQWEAVKRCREFPPGLEPLYERMLDDIKRTGSETARLYQDAIAVICLVQRPLTLEELAIFVDIDQPPSRVPEIISETVKEYGSFLILEGRTVMLIHQSAKDYIIGKAQQRVYPKGIKLEHYNLFKKSREELVAKLGRNIYSLDSSGTSIDEIEQFEPIDRLPTVRYACVYWINHLRDCDPLHNARDDLRDNGSIYSFIQTKYLFWLEALSLCRNVRHGLASIRYLETLVSETSAARQLAALLTDAARLLGLSIRGIEQSPLQAYVSALMFSPTSSLVKQYFQDQAPKQITVRPNPSTSWNLCLQTLEGHTTEISSLALSFDSKRLVSGSQEGGIIQVWDLDNGQCLRTLRHGNHNTKVKSLAYSSNSSRIASMADDDIQIWNSESGECLKTIRSHIYGFRESISEIAFSSDLSLYAWVADDSIEVRGTSDIAIYQHIYNHATDATSVVFSPDSTRFASCYSSPRDYKLKLVTIWDVHTGASIHTFSKKVGEISSNKLSFSIHSVLFAAFYSDTNNEKEIIEIWDVESETLRQKIQCRSPVEHLQLSSDLSQLAAWNEHQNIQVWDVDSGECVRKIRTRERPPDDISAEDRVFKLGAFSHDLRRLATVSYYGTVIKIWDLGRSSEDPKNDEDLESDEDPENDEDVESDEGLGNGDLVTIKSHGNPVLEVTFSHDSLLLASASGSHHTLIKIWTTSTGRCVRTLRGHRGFIRSLLFLRGFFRESYRLASMSESGGVMVWDPVSGIRLYTLDDVSPWADLLQSSTSLITWNDWDSIDYWDIISGERQFRLRVSERRRIEQCSLSGCLTRLLSIIDSPSGAVMRIWDTTTGECLTLRKLKRHNKDYKSQPQYTAFVFSRDSNHIAGIVRYWPEGSHLIVCDTYNSGAPPLTVNAPQHGISQLVFSPDSSMLASACTDHRVILWDVGTGDCLRSLNLGQWVSSISFNGTGSELEIDSMIFTLSEILDSSPSSDEALNAQDLPHRGTTISYGSSWIRYGLQNLVWLPEEYRPREPWTSVLSNGILATGLESGKVLIYHVDKTGSRTTAGNQPLMGPIEVSYR